MATPTSVRNLNGLSKEEIIKYCPSVYAEGKHESRSGRYTYFPTGYMLEILAKETGYFPTQVLQSGSRIEGKKEYTKHLIRLRHRDLLGMSELNQDVHEVLLMNSHDGTSGYVIQDGIFRLVCTNGLIRGDIDNTIKIYHKGGDTVVQEVVESTLAMGGRSQEVLNDIAEMKQIELSRPEKMLLSKLAMKTRFDEDEEQQEGKTRAIDLYQPQDFIAPRRREDYADDLYTTVNVIEENLRDGGITRRDRRNYGQRRSTREVRGIDQLTKMESMLWELAEGMKKIKQDGHL